MPYILNKNNKFDLVLPGSSEIRLSIELSTELISATKNRDFSAAPDWSAPTGWSLSSATWLHATGNIGITELTSAYLATYAIRKNYRYYIEFTVSGYSAGSVTPRIGNVSGQAVAANGTYKQIIQAAQDDSSLIFEPSSLFVGALDNISLKKIVDIIYSDSTGNIVSTSNASNGISTNMIWSSQDRVPYELMPPHGTWLYDSSNTCFRVYDTNQGGWFPCKDLGGNTVFSGNTSLTRGLLCCFNLEDNAASTTVADSASRVTGTASVNTSTLHATGSGVTNLGDYFDFRGGAYNDYITINGLESTAGQYIDYGKPFSVSMWITTDTVAGTYGGAFWCTGGIGVVGVKKIGICRYAASPLVFWGIDGSNYRYYNQGTVTMSTGTWYHIVLTYNGGSTIAYDSGNVKLYINNSLTTLANIATSGTIASSCAIGSTHYLGMYPGDTTYDHDGKMDQVLVWNRELTAAEVSLLYNSGNGLSFT